MLDYSERDAKDIVEEDVLYKRTYVYSECLFDPLSVFISVIEDTLIACIHITKVQA